MSYDQRIAFREWVEDHPGATIVEKPCLMDNETFGKCVYFTTRHGSTFVERGIKPNGEMFTVV